MAFSQHFLDELRARVGVVEVVGRRVRLTRKGREFMGLCPFHNEKSPSFSVNEEKGFYHCFGCGAHGSAIDFVMNMDKLTFPEAVERLAAEAGMEVPQSSPGERERDMRAKGLLEVVELACKFFEKQLRMPDGRVGLEYLRRRGISEESIAKFRLGYAPDSRGALKAYLTREGVSEDAMVEAGLLIRIEEEGKTPYDRFRGRVMFPIADQRNRIIAFGGRVLGDGEPKYLNSPETPLFHKGFNLYGLPHALAKIRDGAQAIVVEGYTDVISLHQAGIGGAMAPLGTALTEDQLLLLWRTAPEPVLAFDGDEAGLRAAHRAARLSLPLLRPGFSLRFVFLPAGEDPDSFIARAGAGAMRNLLNGAQPLSEVVWRGETEGRDFSTPERRAGLERALAEIVALIADTKIADYYRREFDNRVFEAFKRRAPRLQNRAPERGGPAPPQGWREASRFQRPPLQTVSPAVKASLLGGAPGRAARQLKEMELAGLVLEDPEIAAKQGEILAALPFSDPSLDMLRRELLNLAASGFPLENRGLENHLVAKGMAELIARLKGGRARRGEVADDKSPGGADAEDAEARFLRAAHQLRDMVELEPERRRAAERHKSEATEESWTAFQRARGAPSD